MSEQLFLSSVTLATGLQYFLALHKYWAIKILLWKRRSVSCSSRYSQTNIPRGFILNALSLEIVHDCTISHFPSLIEFEQWKALSVVWNSANLLKTKEMRSVD